MATRETVLTVSSREAVKAAGAQGPLVYAGLKPRR